MFIRRIFYDKATGGIVMTEYMQGDIVVADVDWLYAHADRLAGRSPTDTGCFEWTEPDAEVEALFATKVVGVDVTQTPPVLVWADPPVEPDETEATV